MTHELIPQMFQNDEVLVTLLNLHPKTLPRALHLLENGCLFEVYVDRDLDSGSCGVFNETTGEFETTCSVGEMLGQGVEITREQHTGSWHAAQPQLAVFKDVKYPESDNDSDEEFIESYETQKTKYTRMERELRYKTQSQRASRRTSGPSNHESPDWVATDVHKNYCTCKSASPNCCHLLALKVTQTHAANFDTQRLALSNLGFFALVMALFSKC